MYYLIIFCYSNDVYVILFWEEGGSISELRRVQHAATEALWEYWFPAFI